MPPRHETVRSLWVGREIPPAQSACVRSFLRAGHGFELFCCSVPRGVPNGVAIRDAREILPEEQVFEYGAAAGPSAGSLGAFSNMFRYALLVREGGYWVDTDVFCLHPFRGAAGDDLVIGSERGRDGRPFAGNCVLRCPAGHGLAVRCLEESRGADRSSLKFGQTGPQLVDRLVGELGLRGSLSDPDEFCPIDWRAYRDLCSDVPLPRATAGVHLWNEMWRKSGEAIPWPGPEGSVMRRLSETLAPARARSDPARSTCSGTTLGPDAEPNLEPPLTVRASVQARLPVRFAR